MVCIVVRKHLAHLVVIDAITVDSTCYLHHHSQTSELQQAQEEAYNGCHLIVQETNNSMGIGAMGIGAYKLGDML